MARLIDANTLKDTIQKWVDMLETTTVENESLQYMQSGELQAYNHVLEMIENSPTVKKEK